MIEPAGRAPEPENSPSTVRFGPRESNRRAGLTGTRVVPTAGPQTSGVTPPARYAATDGPISLRTRALSWVGEPVGWPLYVTAGLELEKNGTRVHGRVQPATS